MSKYKISISKGNKKYSIIMKAPSEEEVRKKVHSEGYSILGVQALSDEKIKGHKFFFQARDKTGAIKKGKIVAMDPLKVFVKLKKGLGYNIELLFSQGDKDKSLEYKKKLVSNIEEQYRLYIEHKSTEQKQKEKERQQELENSKSNLDNFYLKKQIEETQKLIQFVLNKLKNIIDNASELDVTEENKEKIQKIYEGIVKIKNTSNSVRLKEVGEKALLKIGEIELRILHRYQNDHWRGLLKETNGLLKKLGSKETIEEKNGTVEEFKSFMREVSEGLKGFFVFRKREKKIIDKESTSYWKTELLISKYEDKQLENTKNIFKNIYLIFFPKKREKLDDLFIKRRVILQNILILKAKATGKIQSYTALKNSYQTGVDFVIGTLKQTNNYIFFLIIIFTSVFIGYLLATEMKIVDFEINIQAIFYFVYIIIFSILLYLSRGLLTLMISIVFFIFLFILGGVNF